jgi:tetratricopeptide (TPR) repeat protein
MNVKRIEMLEERIKDEPDDPFFPYALALEYKGRNDKKSLDLLLRSKEKFPNYLPIYYQLAELLTLFSEKDSALKCYDEGITVALAQGDLKIRAELQNAKQNLLFEDD